MPKYTELSTFILEGLKCSILQFTLPLCHNSSTSSSSETISVVIKIVNAFDPKTSKTNRKCFDYEEDIKKNQENLILYLQGGPGFPSPITTGLTNPGYLKPLLDKNYTVILLDQRGTGLSSVIDTESLLSRGDTLSQFEYIKNFRADSIVHDSEYIRKQLIGPSKWSLLGQSFGGFTSISYISFYPDSIKKVLLTGGLAPLTIDSVDDVYDATFERTKERNIAYYKKYPEDIDKVNTIVKYLESNHIILPNGGILTVDRFRGLGLSLGGSGGSFNLHILVTTMYTELHNRENKKLSYTTKMTLMNYLGFETNILYFLFQEAIYLNGPGKKSDWAADRVFQKRKDFENADMFMFTGEIVTKSMLQSYKELQPLAKLANFIHQYSNWSMLYNIENLRSITWDKIPIVAAVYLDDQYVDYQLGKKNLEIFEYKPVVTNQLFHNGLRAAPIQIIEQLHRVLDYGDYL